MDQKLKEFKVAIIDPVGKKAGLDHYDFSLAKALTGEGLPTFVFSNFHQDKYVINQFGFSFNSSLLNGVRILALFISALIKSKKAGGEIIILHVFHSSLADKVFANLVRAFGFRLCVIVHDIEGFVRKGSGLKKIAHKAEWIVVHNHYSYDQLKLKIAAEDFAKVSVIPHGHFLDLVNDDEVPVPLNFNEGNIYLLYFGMIKKSKGLEVLLEAMKTVPDNVHLIIAGRVRDSDIGAYAALINELKNVSSVQMMLRYITNKERNYLFKRCDIAVLPYHQIFQSGVLLMSMSFGLPVIVSDLPANREIVNDKNGILFKSGNAFELAEKIKLLTGDELLRKSLSENSMDYISKNHNWSIVGVSFKNIFS